MKAEETWLSLYFDLMKLAHVCKEDHDFEGVIGLRKIHRDFGLLKTVFGRDPGPLTSDNRSHPRELVDFYFCWCSSKFPKTQEVLQLGLIDRLLLNPDMGQSARNATPRRQLGGANYVKEDETAIHANLSESFSFENSRHRCHPMPLC